MDKIDINSIAVNSFNVNEMTSIKSDLSLEKNGHDDVISDIERKIDDLDKSILRASIKLYDGSSVDALDLQKGLLDRRSFMAIISSFSQTLRSSADRLMQSVG